MNMFKEGDKVAFAIVTPFSTKCLLDETSIFTAEMSILNIEMSILTTLRYIKGIYSNSYVSITGIMKWITG